MSGNENRQLKTNLPMVGQILDFYMKQEINEHGICTLEGIVADGCKDAFVRENNGTTPIQVSLGETLLFAGVAGETAIFQEGEVYRFRIKAYSHTIFMDLKKKNRSFQNAGMTYETLLKEIMKEYSGGDVIDQLSEGTSLGELVVQYEETDWELIRRLASHFHGSILPACEFGSPKIFFGARKEVDMGTLEQYSYSMEKRLCLYKRLEANGYSDYSEADALEFRIEDRRYLEIGSQTFYQGTPLYIGRVEGVLTHGEVIFHYTLKTKRGMGQGKRYGEHLAGVSLTARVLESVKDKIKVKLDIDETQDVGTAWEFPYQTMYTAEGEGGWYCMPERGDRVMIYFPGKKESEAVGTNSVRESGSAVERRGNPEIKYFRTIHGKEIRFTPEAVEIICSDGVNPSTGEEKQVKLVLDQNHGITITSTEGITLESGRGIRLEAEETIELYASDQIKLHCKKGRIQMDTMIDIAGPDVRIN